MAAINGEQLAQFEEQGYLVVEGLFDPECDLDPVVAEYHEVLDRLATELYRDGRIESTYADLPFGERLTKVCRASGQVHAQYFDFSLPQNGVQDNTPFWAGPAVFAALRNERLLDAVECFIGPEIYSNPVQHVRLKPPEHLTPINPKTGRIQLGITPWHQDNGVVLEEADQSDILTVWFPLADVPVDNGCMEVLPGSHKQGLMHHCPGKWGLEVPEAVQDRASAVSLPMKRGDVLFMTRLTCHSALPNKSDTVRWSFDLRYNPIGQPTGRGVFPGFVARSRKHPEAELHDAGQWNRLWHEARASLAARENRPFNRWSADHPVCA
ncbi:MAG: phytanoyl-CoA dioxygenase [Candidatus Latescibacteria bacterium]|nr:phytanoyl-CoA dioxygenase [Candidatus Latescibacterota bacterium]